MAYDYTKLEGFLYKMREGLSLRVCTDRFRLSRSLSRSIAC